MTCEGSFHKHRCANCDTLVEHENPSCIDDRGYECDRCWEELKEDRQRIEARLRKEIRQRRAS